MGHVKFYFILNASALKIFIASFMLYLYGSLVYKTAVCQYGLGDQKSMFTLTAHSATFCLWKNIWKIQGAEIETEIRVGPSIVPTLLTFCERILLFGSDLGEIYDALCLHWV